MPVAPDKAEIEAALLALIAQRGLHSSACPSEVARALSPTSWRELMPRIREASWRLMQSGQLDISQGGVSIARPDAAIDAVKGPVRIRLPRLPAGDNLTRSD